MDGFFNAIGRFLFSCFTREIVLLSRITEGLFNKNEKNLKTKYFIDNLKKNGLNNCGEIYCRVVELHTKSDFNYVLIKGIVY